MRKLGLLILSLALIFVVLLPVKSSQAAPTITIGTLESLDNLDPAMASGEFSQELLSQLYTGLTRQIPGTLRYELALAASHTVSADGLIHTFTLRPNIMFSDGTPITAQTFVDSINRALHLNLSGSAITPYLKSASADSTGALILTLKVPIPYLEALLSLSPYFPVNAFPADSIMSGIPSTNGLYSVTTFAPGKTITLTPATGPIIVIQHFDRPADLREALKAHHIDIAWRGLPASDFDDLAKIKGITITTAPSLQTFYLALDLTTPALHDPVARSAIAYLINRPDIVQRGLQNTGIPLSGLLPPQIMSDAPPYPDFDTTQAAAVLTQGGYSKFKRITAQIQTSRLLYGDLYSSAADVMISNMVVQQALVLNRFDMIPTQFLDQVNQGTLGGINLIGWTPLVPHPDAYLRPLLAGEIAQGIHYTNPTIQSLFDQAAIAPDGTALYAQVQNLAMQGFVVIPLWQGQQVIAAWDNISNIKIEPNFLLHYDQLTIQ